MSKQQTVARQKGFQDYLAQGVREAALILLMALSIFLLMALVSYQPSDPGWTSTGYTSTVANYGGRAGAWFADVLIYFLGYVAYLFPVLLAYRAWTMFRRRNEEMPWQWALVALRLFGLILTVTSATALLALYSVAGLSSESAGILGRELADRSIHAFNLRGSTLIWVSSFLIGITVLTGLSWVKLMDFHGASTLALLKRIGIATWGMKDRLSSTDDKRIDPPSAGQKASSARSAPSVAPEPAVPMLSERVDSKRPGLFKRLFRRQAPASVVAAPALPKPEKKRNEPKVKQEPVMTDAPDLPFQDEPE